MNTRERMEKMYAWIKPINKPSASMRMGKNSGATASRIAPIIEPLMMLPKSRMASATVRVSSPRTFIGSINGLGLRYDFRYLKKPWVAMPYTGTATKTHNARAAVVEREPVGGWNPGTMVGTLHVAMNRNSVPMKGRKRSGS